MGLLDKLRNSFQKPLADPTERQYYEIVFNLLRVVYGIRYPAVKRYVDHTLGMPCNEDALRQALVYIKQTRRADGEVYYWNSSDETDLIAAGRPEVYEISKEILKRVPYTSLAGQKEQLYYICMEDEISGIKAQIVRALDVPPEKMGKLFLCKTLGSIQANGCSDPFLLYLAFKQSFFGEEAVKKAVVRHYFDILRLRVKEPNLPVYFGAMALRAANFARFRSSGAAFRSLPDAECEQYIRGSKAFAALPFGSYPMLMGKYIGLLREASAFHAEKTFRLFDLKKFWDTCSEDDFFMDAVCHYGWLQIRELYNNEVNTVIEMANTLYDFALKETD